MAQCSSQDLTAAMCRLCLNNCPNCQNLFGSELLRTEILQKILKYIKLEIFEDDLLSSEICAKCIDQLERFHEFCEVVIANQEMMRYTEKDFPTDPPTAITDVTFVESKAEHLLYPETQTTGDVDYPDDNNIYESSNNIEQISNVEEPVRNHDIKLEQAKGDDDAIEFHNEDEELDDDDQDENYLNSETDENEYLSQDEANEPADKMKPKVELGELFEEGHQFAGFPKVIVRNGCIAFRGEVLTGLLSRFFSMECDLCPETKSKSVFTNLTALNAHYTSEHHIKCYVFCCGLKFITTRTMAHHMARHLQPSAFKCTICDKIMTCPRNLEFHMQNHRPEKERPLACQHCPRRFSYCSALMEHSIMHKPRSEREVYVCDECGKCLVHIIQRKAFICHICARSFSSNSNLKYHLTTHQPRINEEQCEQCGKWLKNKLCLRKHLLQHSEVRLKCDRCDYSAVNKQSLRNHKKIHHSDLKPFSCQQCGKSFKLRTTLQNHTAQHTGHRNFSCEFCPRKFASSGNYYSHRKRMHPQELAEANKRKEEAEFEFRVQVLDKRSLETADGENVFS